MEPRITEVEPARVLSFLDWFGKSEKQTLLIHLEKSRYLALIEATELQAKATMQPDSENIERFAKEKLLEAAELEVAIKVLSGINPQTTFIARIEL